jgi:hypothetical protein
MKIGIVNLQFSRNNYGALLQAAALESYIASLCSSAEVCHIDVRLYPPKAYRERTLSFYSNWICRNLKRMLCGWPGQPSIGNYSVFSDFRSKYLKLSDKCYYNLKDYEDEGWDYDCVIVGSDQVFRLQYVAKKIDAFFLTFLPEKCRRVSYAASFGVDYWEASSSDAVTECVRDALGKFSAISVREDSGVSIVKDSFGLNAEHVLDPTLLIGRQFFDSIIEDAALHSRLEVDWSVHLISQDAPLFEALPALSQKYNKDYQNIFCGIHKRWPLPPVVNFSSVPEWLLAIRSTNELVITDSFHCVCFCILYRRDFVVFPSSRNGVPRMESLFKLLGIENRLCYSEDDFEGFLNRDAKIDYDSVFERLGAERISSRRFLVEAIHGCGN